MLELEDILQASFYRCEIGGPDVLYRGADQFYSMISSLLIITPLFA